MRLVKIPYNNAVGNNEEPVGDQANRQTPLVAERVDAVGRENRKLYTTANQNE